MSQVLKYLELLFFAAFFATFNAAKSSANKNVTNYKKAATPPIENSFTEWVTVSYSPDAACYSTTNQIFKQSVINKYYQKDGQGQIPNFPNTSLILSLPKKSIPKRYLKKKNS